MIFFSAHGVPLSYVKDSGDPYKDQMEECIFLIMKELKARGINNEHTLAYQVSIKLYSRSSSYYFPVFLASQNYLRLLSAACGPDFISSVFWNSFPPFLVGCWSESSWSCTMVEAIHWWSSSGAWPERCKKSPCCSSQVSHFIMISQFLLCLESIVEPCSM